MISLPLGNYNMITTATVRSCPKCRLYAANMYMLEPASAAIGCYIVSNTPHIIRKSKPFLSCRPKKWVKRHKVALTDAFVDEFAQFVLDQMNHIHATPTQVLLICIFYVLIVCLAFL